MEATGLTLLFVGFAGLFIARLTEESAERDLRWKGTPLPADFRTLLRGLNYRKLRALYKREFPKGRKMKVSFYLNSLSLFSILIGLPILLFSNR